MFVLLPILLLYLLLGELLDVVVALAMPIVNLFPKGTFDEAYFPVLIALVLIVGASFVIGLAMRSETAIRAGRKIEEAVLGRIPLYNVLKSLTTGFAKAGQGTAFRPAVLIFPDGHREMVYFIEDHGDGNATVMLPWVPTTFAGTLKIVKQEQIDMLDVNLADFTKVLGQWGVGTRDLFDKGVSE